MTTNMTDTNLQGQTKVPHQAAHVTSFGNSLFYQRLRFLADEHRGSGNTSLENLCTATKRLLENATAISKQIVCHLPQYTSHDEVHLWNVLSFMEELAGGKNGIQQLGAGDCAMAVWVAFIHDLGMVLDAGEIAALDAADHFDFSTSYNQNLGSLTENRVQAWRTYRDGHEHWNAIRSDPQSTINQMRLGIIRASCIRDSHAQLDIHTGHCRINDWLQFLVAGDPIIQQALDDFPLAERLVRVAVSHNQEIEWLPRQLSRIGVTEPHGEYMDPYLGYIHWTWIGWILRMADIFDCDKSRTPRILFDHNNITEPRSKTEWQKHLSIRTAPTWNGAPDGRTLLFICQVCPSPIVEKAIHQLLGWMNEEITKVRNARNSISSQDGKPVLALPSEARVDIKIRKDQYLYHDMEFRLDRDAVVELLMGESLYGGPELALRELVQNSLDAVHLRDQRNHLATLDKEGGEGKGPPTPPTLGGTEARSQCHLGQRE